jgi:hypothetical protein
VWDFRLIGLSTYYLWSFIDIRLNFLDDRKSHILKYLLNMFTYLYGFRKGVGSQICDWPWFHLTSLRPSMEVNIASCLIVINLATRVLAWSCYTLLYSWSGTALSVKSNVATRWTLFLFGRSEFESRFRNKLFSQNSLWFHSIAI